VLSLCNLVVPCANAVDVIGICGLLVKVRNCRMQNVESKMRNQKLWKWMRNGG